MKAHDCVSKSHKSSFKQRIFLELQSTSGAKNLSLIVSVVLNAAGHYGGHCENQGKLQ